MRLLDLTFELKGENDWVTLISTWKNVVGKLCSVGG